MPSSARAMIVINPKATQPTQSCRSSAIETNRVNHRPAANDARAAIAEKRMLPKRKPRLISLTVKRRAGTEARLRCDRAAAGDGVVEFGFVGDVVEP